MLSIWSHLKKILYPKVYCSLAYRKPFLQARLYNKRFGWGMHISYCLKAKDKQTGRRQYRARPLKESTVLYSFWVVVQMQSIFNQRYWRSKSTVGRKKLCHLQKGILWIWEAGDLWHSRKETCWAEGDVSLKAWHLHSAHKLIEEK